MSSGWRGVNESKGRRCEVDVITIVLFSAGRMEEAAP